MKVISLTAENFKRLKAVEITPDGSVVVVAGRNAQGKSSVLDAIWAALAGKAAKGVAEDPVRHGETGARVRLDLGDIVVTRTWPAGGKSQLLVEATAGARFPSPQKVLDDLLGRFSFDPLAFAQAKPAEQRDILLDLVGLDLKAFDDERRGHYDDRTEANREVKRLEGHLSQMPATPASTPDEEVSADQLLDSVMEARRLDAEIQSLRDEHERLTAALQENVEAGRRAVQARAAIPEETSVLVQSLSTIEETNRAVRAKKERAATEQQLRQAREMSGILTKRIESVDERKAQAIRSAGLPVEGLGFSEDGVTLDGVPFSQSSAAERLRTSVAIAMAANPNIRVIRITDGSLLDSDNLRIIKEMATEHDFQVWLEVVDSTGTVGIQIEDGEVVKS